jgi:hypothetical protein
MRMMNEFEAQVLSDLCVLKSQMNGLVGDGNTGRITELERRIERHEQNLQRAKGFMAAMSVLMAVIEVAMEAFGGIEDGRRLKAASPAPTVDRYGSWIF